MKNGDRRTNKEVLRLCRNINKRADDLERLQPLVVQLQEVLTHVRYETRAVRVTAQPHEDNPFDKIMLDSQARQYAAVRER